MASHVILDGEESKVVPPADISAPAPTIDLKGFHWATVDNKLLETPHFEEKKAEEAKPPLPFPLTEFQGHYAGNGFNTIFRPRPTGDKTFPTPVDLGGRPDDNILELNLTTEQLTFGETIGDIPNRGLFKQKDITLQGLMYLQTIQDRTNPDTGRGDNPDATPIHFEPGMWLTVPPSDNNPINAATLVRMASIPHGTTVNAQCLAPAKATSGPPKFEALDITPFTIQGGNPVPFPSMNVVNNKSPRIPQNLDKFNEIGTITDKIIKNPNLVLGKAIKGQNISETITFEVSTGPPKPFVAGGGTANISFLQGTPNVTTQAIDNPNAHAPFMTAKFWIETVEYSVNVPKFTTRKPVPLKPTMPNSDAPTPVFMVTPPATLPSPESTITIPGIQIQYSQTVHLNFATLTWPHVSVATLVPQHPQPFNMK